MSRIFLMLAIFISLGVASCEGESKSKDETSEESGVTTDMEKNMTTDLAQVPFYSIGGDSTSLANYVGKAVLVVNVASKCGYTKQYAGLEELYRRYKDSGLIVIGFPANNFGGQEPGTDEEILEFCRTTFDVTFPMMSKVRVKGEDKHPLFIELTEKSILPGEIKWNFTKFLIDRNGSLVKRFDSGVEPLSDEMLASIKELL